MARELHDHKVNTANDRLGVEAIDSPGEGGACHRYVISGFTAALNPSAGDRYSLDVELLFQNGPIGEVGVNGITHEALLAVLIDRLRGFQAGPFACRENALALTKLEEAMHWLHARTRSRMARGVEGTHER